MKKVHLAAAVAATLGFALHGTANPAAAADKFGATEKNSPSGITKTEKQNKTTLGDKSCKGKDKECKGKDKECRGKDKKGGEKSCKGKEGSCKGKDKSCKGEDKSCKGEDKE